MANLSIMNQNPGDLRFAGQVGASQGKGGFASFSDAKSGYAALLNDLQAKINKNPNQTLADFANVYAPSLDGNNSAQYAAKLANQLNVAPNATLGSLESRIGDLANAVANNEGYQGNATQPSHSSIPEIPLKTSPVLQQQEQGQQQQLTPKTFAPYLPPEMTIGTVGQQTPEQAKDYLKGEVKGALGGFDSLSAAHTLAGQPGVLQAMGVSPDILNSKTPAEQAGSLGSQGLMSIVPVGEATKVPGIVNEVLHGSEDSVLQAVMPRLTPKVAAETPTETKGILSKIVPKASKYQQAVADAMRPYFNPKATFSANAQAAEKAITDLADQTEAHIAANDHPIVIKELNSRIAKSPEPLSLKGTPFEKQITPLKNAFIQLVKNNGGTVKGAFKALRQFDDLVEQTWPTLWDNENAPMRGAVTALRNTVKDFVENNLPEESPYKALLDQQTKLFDARDALREKAALGAKDMQGEIGTTAPQRWAMKHPGTIGLAKKAVSGAALIGGGAGLASAFGVRPFGGSQ